MAKTCDGFPGEVGRTFESATRAGFGLRLSRTAGKPAPHRFCAAKDIFLVSWLRMLAYNRVTQFLARLPEAYRRLTV
nr:hypothetical protein [Anaerolineae bacterium]